MPSKEQAIKYQSTGAFIPTFTYVIDLEAMHKVVDG